MKMSIFNIPKNHIKFWLIGFLISLLMWSILYYKVNSCYENNGVYMLGKNAGCCYVAYKIHTDEMEYVKEIPMICKNNRPISINTSSVNKTFWRKNVFND